MDSQFTSNDATNTGGGLEIDVYDNSQVIIQNSLIATNTANNGNGGGLRIRIVDSGVVSVSKSMFRNNQAASGNGGGLSVESIGSGPATVWLIDNEFDNNQAASSNDYYLTGSNLTSYVLSNSIYLPAVLANYPSTNLKVRITDISIQNNDYVVAFETDNFTPQTPINLNEHVHFYFNTVPPDEAGSPGSGPWIAYGGSSPFTGYETIHRPPGAWQMCALVANPNHSVQADSGNCFKLP